ncbi:hypothetical protein D3C86_1588370 [compost metagenome]
MRIQLTLERIELHLVEQQGFFSLSFFFSVKLKEHNRAENADQRADYRSQLVLVAFLMRKLIERRSFGNPDRRYFINDD